MLYEQYMKQQFMKIYIDNLTMSEAIDELDKFVSEGNKGYVVTPNVDHIVKLEYDEKLNNVYKEASFVFADGKPIVSISRKYKMPLKEKVSGSDLFPLLCERAASKNYTMYFLGAGEGVAQKAAENLIDKYEGLKVVGTFSPKFDFENDEEYISKMIHDINLLKPDILIVGLGCPKQEYFIYDYYKEIDSKLFLGLGASIDFEAGNVKRAPKWMQKIGLEWFYRFLKEPRRMFKRYFVDDMKIFKLYRKYKPRKNKKTDKQGD